jgi:hypothetical protein
VFRWPRRQNSLLYRVKVEWEEADGRIATADLGQVECGACQSSADVGLKLADSKPILAPLQQVIVTQQLRRYCETARLCPSCQRRRHLKDHRCGDLLTIRSRSRYGCVASESPQQYRPRRNRIRLRPVSVLLMTACVVISRYSRFTSNRRSMPARVSISSVRRWQDGAEQPATCLLR